MIFRHAFLLLSMILLLTGCQSGGDDNSSAGKSKPSTTMQHLQRDKTVVQRSTTGTFSVNIFPRPLTSADQAVAVMSNCPEESHFQWEVNSYEVDDNDSKLLENALFHRGDTLHLTAHCGSLMAEDETIVQNTPPSISAVKFQSPEVISGQDLTVIPEATDHDDDFISYRYTWSIDGIQKEDIDEATLPGVLLKKGTQVTLAVTPYDDYGDGETFQGLSFYIPNAAPIINSQPTPLLSNDYVYNVEAVDPDGDELSYQLSQGPPGMTINDKTGTLKWSINQNTPTGNFDIEIIVEDSEGLQAKQFYILSLSKPESEN